MRFLFLFICLFTAFPFAHTGKFNDAITAFKTKDIHSECAPADLLKQCEIQRSKLEKKLSQSWSEGAELHIQVRRTQQDMHHTHDQLQLSEQERMHLEDRLATLLAENKRLRQYTTQYWLPPVAPPPLQHLPSTPRKKKSARFTEERAGPSMS